MEGTPRTSDTWCSQKTGPSKQRFWVLASARTTATYLSVQHPNVCMHKCTHTHAHDIPIYNLYVCVYIYIYFFSFSYSYLYSYLYYIYIYRYVFLCKYIYMYFMFLFTYSDRPTCLSKFRTWNLGGSKCLFQNFGTLRFQV